MTAPPLFGALHETLFGAQQDNRMAAQSRRAILQREAKAAQYDALRQQQTDCRHGLQQQTLGTLGAWQDWNLTYVYTNASTATTEATVSGGLYDTTWLIWNAASTGNTITSNVWYTWNATYIQYNGDRPPVMAPPTTPPLTAEQAEEYRRAIERREAKHAAQLAREVAACERATALLREFLDERQRDTLDKHRWFEVVSPKGRTYRIHQGRAGNVYLIEGGHQVMRYCIHPADLVPDEDTMLAQALMVRCAEDDFVSIANKTPLRAAA